VIYKDICEELNRIIFAFVRKNFSKEKDFSCWFYFLSKLNNFSSPTKSQIILKIFQILKVLIIKDSQIEKIFNNLKGQEIFLSIALN